MSNSLSTVLAALSDPTRRAVVERLILGQASVSELHEPHNMALPTFMRHLKVLEASGLVRSIKRGRVRTCQISVGPILEVQRWLAWQTTLRERMASPSSAIRFRLRGKTGPGQPSWVRDFDPSHRLLYSGGIAMWRLGGSRSCRQG